MEKEYKVTVYVEIPFETYVKAVSEAEAKIIALNREPYIPYMEDYYKEEDFVIGDIMEFPNLGKGEEPEIEECEKGELFL